MIDWCCDVRTAGEEVFVFKGNHSKATRQVLRISKINSFVGKETEHYRIFGKSNFEKLRMKYRELREVHIDEYFRPSDASLGTQITRPVTWRRLSQIYPKNTPLMDHSNQRQIIASKEKDAYLMASLAVMARNPRNILDVLDFENSISQEGLYKLNICIRGQPQQILIDDCIPVYEESIDRSVYSRLDSRSIWINLFEKAYAKTHGSYQAIYTGYVHEVFSTFTVAPCLNHQVFEDPTYQQDDKLRQLITEAVVMSYPAACSSRKKPVNRSLLPCHAYPLKDFQNIDGVKSVILGNLPLRPKYLEGGDQIVMSLQQFAYNFQAVDIAYIREGFNSHYYSFKLKPSKFAVFQVQLQEYTTTYFTLSRHHPSKGKLRIMIARYNPTKHCQYELVSCSYQEFFSDVTIYCQSLRPAKYVVLCNGQVGNQCLLKIYSPQSVVCKESSMVALRLLQDVIINRCMLVLDRNYFVRNGHDWYVCESMFEQIGLGAIFIQMNQYSTLNCQVELDPVFLAAQEHLRVINRAQNFTKSIVKRGQSLILLFESVGDEPELSFPPSEHLSIKLII